jgi:chemotaxis protein MotB
MYRQIIAIMVLVAGVSACVPAKRFQESERTANQYRVKSEECEVEVDLLKKRVAQLDGDIEKFVADKHALEQDTTLYGMKNRTLKKQLEILENDLKLLASRLGDSPEYKALMKHLLQMQDELVGVDMRRIDTEKAIEEQKRVLAQTESALAESEAMLARSEQQLQNKDLEIESKNMELAGKDEELRSRDSQLADAQRSIEEQAARLRELEAALSAKDSAMAELRNTIANALVDFSSDELAVHHKDGKVYVSLEEQLLFASGKYDVNEKGVQAIRKIAGVLASHNGLDIVVEGHTDNVPYNGRGVLIDNWDLSVKRATSVLRILLNSGNIPASRIQASGRADSVPVDSANTPEARRKNRRTEIILAPNIDQILSTLQY